MKILVWFFFILTIFFSELYAQDPGAVHAKILDSQTLEPIPFATVKIMRGSAMIGGVISNADGSFQVPSIYLSGVDSLVVSCIGYSSLAVTRNQLPERLPNELYLKRTSVLLKEIVVTPPLEEKLTPREIVFRAIQNIPENYPSKPFSYAAYYRDYQKDGEEYVNLHEAIVQILDKGFGTNDFDSTKIKLNQYRLNEDFRTDSSTAIAYDSISLDKRKFIPGTTVFPFGGNELSLLRIHDAIRNYKTMSYSFVDQFSLHFIKFHSFTLLGIVYLDKAPLYHISFQSHDDITGPEYTANGEIFIALDNYAIHRLTYSNFMRNKAVKNLLYSINVEYTQAGSLFYPNYISFNNSFIAKNDAGFKVSNIVYDNLTESFVVTFNRAPLRATALDKKNYDFKFGKKTLAIEEITMRGLDDHVVYVRVRNASDYKPWENQNVGSPKLNAVFKKIKDLQGNEINKTAYKSMKQFRELFLQKLDDIGEPMDHGPFMAKEIPLSKNAALPKPNPSSFWMNTPLIKN